MGFTFWDTQMEGSMKKALAIVLTGLFFVGVSGVAKADPLDKLGRGSINVLTGWLEIPKTVYEDSADNNPLFGATFGLLHGAGCALYRTGAGLVDIVTAPIPPYDNHIVPEYVF